MKTQEIAVGMALVALVAGCAPARTTPRTRPANGAGEGGLVSERDQGRLAKLGAERAGSAAPVGYRIGPDDLLDVRIPDLVEQAGVVPVGTQTPGGAVLPVAQNPIFQQGVRDAAHGDIGLPLIGTVPAANRSTIELEQEIARRLVSGGILVRPRVSVLVVEHRSSVVAVVGSVERPGVYPLTKPDATLADMIWAAGGPTKDAGRLVAFVPAGAANATASLTTTPDLNRLEGGEAIRLDLETLLHAAGGGTQNPRVRPGDLVSVAPAGNVQVDGWVGKPGAYPVTRSLTVTGAIAAAGGKLFPADARNVALTRVSASGGEEHLIVDVDGITAGRVPDLLVTDGDVVRVPVSLPKMVPYGVWTLITAMVHVGGTVPLF